MSIPQLKGYLVVKVLEAAGHNSEDIKVWDDTLKEGFVKVEVRGGAKTVKKQTTLQKVQDNLLMWEEQLALDVMDDSTELRILLCRPKAAGDRGSSIVSACGIYMKDILEAVPIDKYFELFKPGEGAEGGFIRVSMNFLLPEQVRDGGALLESAKKKRSSPFGALLRLALVVSVGAAVAYKVIDDKNKQEKKKEEEEEKSKSSKKSGWFGK